MRFCTRFCGVFLGLAIAGLLAAPLAAQAAPATGVDDVVSALGLTPEPADYVVLVDTSGSMNQGGRYDTVRHELGTLLSGLNAADRVSLLTFDSTATTRYHGKVGRNPSAILTKLPVTASGMHTDIGAAIAAGLSELEGPETRRLAALILITDGVLDTVSTSKYANVNSTAWKKLTSRASALGEQHQVAGYAVSLKATTDAGLLRKVFPRASEVNPGQVGERFADVGADLVRLQAAEALKEELAKPIGVSWAGDLGAALANNTPVDIELSFSSPYAHVPASLSEIAARAPAGLDVVLTGLPEKLSLKPGEKLTVKAQARVTGTAAPDASVSLVAKVDSPWRKVLEKDLGLKLEPTLDGAALVPAPPIKLPPTLLPTLGGIAGMLLAAAAVWWLARMMVTPQLRGLLTFRRNRREIADVVLSGRRQKLKAPDAATDLVGLAGTVTGAWGKARGQRAVRLDVRWGAETAMGLVLDGDVLQMGDMEISYTSDRRRILDMIGAPRA